MSDTEREEIDDLADQLWLNATGDDRGEFWNSLYRMWKYYAPGNASAPFLSALAREIRKQAAKLPKEPPTPTARLG